jgi:hypothetical protein
VLLVETKKKGKKPVPQANDKQGEEEEGPDPEEERVEEEEPLSPEMEKQFQEALTLKPQFKMGKREWYNVLDELDK